MKVYRPLFALLALSVVCGSDALAAPPDSVIGVGVGVHGAIGIPPISVPPVNLPSVQTPKMPQAGAAVNSQSSLTMGDVQHGSVTSVNGTAVTLQLANGTVQTFNVAAQTAARLQGFVNKSVAFRVQNGTFVLVGFGTPPLHGTLLALNGSNAQVKMPNGAVQSFTVSAQQKTWLQAHVGKAIAFWSNANGSIELSQSRQKTSHAANRRP
jgi:hypothetical protein